jgi:2-polyprenyl-3-methyl-5-hydroxy-6-metoxy-1,4-benzoquinol methylase
MLSKKMHTWENTHPVIRGLAQREDITILDFGCGLAQSSWSLARHLLENGKRVTLVLVDIPTIRKSFLLWMGERTGVPIGFLDCTPDIALPALPPCNVCIALDVFEHLHEPLRILRGLDAALLPGGFLVTDVKDHKPEFMHVSPDLTSLRRELEFLGYEEIRPSALFLKDPKQHGASKRP